MIAALSQALADWLGLAGLVVAAWVVVRIALNRWGWRGRL